MDEPADGAGRHFHYLSHDKTQGGHILGPSADELSAKLNKVERFELTLPTNPEFAARDLCEDLSAKTAAVEGGKKESLSKSLRPVAGHDKICYHGEKRRQSISPHLGDYIKA